MYAVLQKIIYSTHFLNGEGKRSKIHKSVNKVFTLYGFITQNFSCTGNGTATSLMPSTGTAQVEMCKLTHNIM